MSKQITENVLFIIGIILYNIFFWKEQMGLNTLFFSIFIIGSSFYLNPESRHSTIARLTALGTLFTSVMVVVFNSQLSKNVHLLSLVVMIGFIQQRELRFLWYGFLLTIISILSVPRKAFLKISSITLGNRKTLGRVGQSVRLAIVPMFVVGIFFAFYLVSNQGFAEVTGQNLGSLFDWFSGFQWSISPQRFFFFIGSIFVIGGFFWQTQSERLVNVQKTHQDDIVRKRKATTNNPLIIKNSSPRNSGKLLSDVNDQYNASFHKKSISIIALKNEYRSGLIMLFSLNVLTFLVNITDIQNIWLGYAQTNASSLWQDVHHGTYVLILTIFMAMGVLLYFFRKNLNFYKNNKWLKIMAVAWMAQNMFLALSVVLRNIKYVNHFGLTYKRIGVFIFIALVLYGLGTMIFKINHKKTAYYLFQHNAWTMYIALVLLTTVNWDVLITSYNLKSSTQPDKHYMIKSLSDKNLSILYKNNHLFVEESNARYNYESLLGQKKRNFSFRKNGQSWLSWNLADHNTLLYLKEHKMQHLAD